MSDDVPDPQSVDARLASLAQFGFPVEAMAAFLAEHEEAASERLEWLEGRRDAATALDERFRALEEITEGHASLEALHGRLNDPFTVEEVQREFDRLIRNIVSWEPPLNRSKIAWFEAGHGREWDALFARLLGLDGSSYPAVVPLHRLFESPERLGEIARHLETIEADEERQRNLIEVGAQRLREHGYPLPDLSTFSLLEGLQRLEAWQTFHTNRERVRLSAVQLIQPFDPDLATEFERQCNSMQALTEAEALTALAEEIQTLAQTLEGRRRALSDAIQTWRGQGIVFPHEGDLHPSDLMEWEANHDTVAATVERHLGLVEQWNRFARYRPSQTAASEHLLGHLDQTERLQDVVDEMDGLWKQLELDGLALLESYEHAGLNLGTWRQRVVDDPMNTMERMTVEREQWDARVALMVELDGLDVSFSGAEEVALRTQLLASEDVESDVLEEMRGFVQRAQRRNQRHRVMLNEELAAMRRAGTLEHEVQTESMNLKELEAHLATLTRSNGATASSNNSGPMMERMRSALEREIETLHQQGWHVDTWRDGLDVALVRVAREISEARPHVQRYDVLRRRLGALPWNRDVELGLSVEAMCKEPHRLAYLSQQIPHYTAHLASRPVEDETYSLNVWMPVGKHPTLVPVPEEQSRKVLQPATSLEDAHEAMLEAMDAEDHDIEDEVQTQMPDEPAASGTSSEPVLAAGDISEPPHEEEANTDAEAPLEPVEVPRAEDSPEPERETLPDEAFEPVQAEVEVNVVPTPQPETNQPTPASGDGTKKALMALSELVALIGLPELAADVEQRGLDAIPDVRRQLAGEVNVAPRDVRIGRLLRLTLRLLPTGDDGDRQRATLLRTMSELIAPLKRWMRRRLEARHSGARGEFLQDAKELGEALDRIPGLGHRLPLEPDEWPLPSDMDGLTTEVGKLARSVQLPSAGGVKA